MKHHKPIRSWPRVHIAQIGVSPGQPQHNTAVMLRAIQGARQASADLVVFPQMAIPGCLLGNRWQWPAFLRECEACGERIREASEGLIIVFGNVGLDWSAQNQDGSVRKYNALFVAAGGRFVGPGPYPFIIQDLPAPAGRWDEYRHFSDPRQVALECGWQLEQLSAPVLAGGWRLGCALGADAPRIEAAHLQRLAAQPVDLLINIASTPFLLDQSRQRQANFAALAATTGKPLIYVNQVGIQNDGQRVFVFAGMSGIYTAGQHSGLPAFEEGALTQALPMDEARPSSAQPAEGVAALAQALLYGARAFMSQCGISRVTVGLSGGIDSALVAALYGRFLEREQLLLVNLPGPFTSPTTIALARQLAANLGCYYVELPIAEGCNLTKAQIDGLAISSPDGQLKKRLQLTDLMLENIQARDRSARLLAALAAAFGGAFTCNTNKAELMVGYSTLYGDLAGFLAPLADLWKGEVYQLARYLNEQVFQGPLIPEGCFQLRPSAELSPTQNVDAGGGDPLIYPYHDRLLASWSEAWPPATPEDILAWYREGCLEERLGYAGRVADLFPDARSFVADLERWWRQYLGLGVAKRIQAPPLLALKESSWRRAGRESQVPFWSSQNYESLKDQILSGSAAGGA